MIIVPSPGPPFVTASMTPKDSKKAKTMLRTTR